MLPVLHLNGYKISGPTVLGRAPHDSVVQLLGAHGYDAQVVAGDDPAVMHQRLAGVLDDCLAAIGRIQSEARSGGSLRSEPWPAIVLETPKGWTGPKVVDGLAVEGTFRAHQVPLSNVRDDPDHLRLLEEWMRSYRPDELFDDNGRVVARPGRRWCLRATAGWEPTRRPTAGCIPGVLSLPDWRDYAVDVAAPGSARLESTARLGQLLRDVYRADGEPGRFRLFCPDETNSNRLGAVFEASDRCLVEDTTGRRRPRVARRAGHGGAERAPVPRVARGVHADRPPWPVRVLRGLRHGVGVDDGAALQVAGGGPRPAPGAGRSRRSTCC